MDLIIKNATVVNSDFTFTGDVGVKDGKITMIAQNIDCKGVNTIDISGKLLLPGAIDVHTHLAFPFGGTVSSDGYLSGTRAAACGGVTTVFDYVVQRKGHGIMEAVNEKRKIADSEACVDYAFHCALTDLNDDKLLEEFDSAADQGITSFKAYMVYKKEGIMMDDQGIMKILMRSKETGTILNVHAENPYIIDMYIDKYLKEGKTNAWYHYKSRPEFVAAEAVERVVCLAKAANAPLYVVHLDNEDGVKTIMQAKNEGYSIFAETCPHYLEFTNEVFKKEDGRNFVCSPPMKGESSRQAIWDGIKNGTISTIATDHCPFKKSEKDWGKDDFTKIPNGCAGIENMYPYMLSKANEGVISFNKAVELCSSNPAKIFGCSGKGNIAVGYDADLVVYDPNIDFTITNSKMHSDTDHTIWEGIKVKGYPTMTFSRGKLVFDNGKFVGTPGWGNYLKRDRFGKYKLSNK